MGLFTPIGSGLRVSPPAPAPLPTTVTMALPPDLVQALRDNTAAVRELLKASPQQDGEITVDQRTSTGFFSVTTVSSEVLRAREDRQYVLFTNDSDTTIYLRLGYSAVLNRGIRLNAAGGSYEMTPRLRNLYRGSVQAIHGGSGNKVLLITEGV